MKYLPPLASILVVTFGWMSTALGHDPLEKDIADHTARIANTPDNVDLLLERARLLIGTRQWNRALADLEQVGRLQPRNPYRSLFRARIFAATGREALAEAELTELIGYQPGYHAYVERATLRQQSGHLTPALADYEHALSFQITVRAALGQGRMLRALSRNSEAIDAYRHALSRLGGAVVIRIELIETLLEERRFSEALTQVSQGRAQAQNTARWDFREAEILARSGRVTQARQYRQRILADVEERIVRRPTAALYVLKAKVLWSLERHDEARRSIQRALSLTPQYLEARQLQVEMDAVQ